MHRTERPFPNSARPAREATDSRRVGYTILLALALPLVVLVILAHLGVPLGCPGRFVYLYSPLSALRLIAVPIAILIAGLLAWSVWWIGPNSDGRRTWPLLIAAIGTIALGAWTFLAPPQYLHQHFINIHSMSHDGAFVHEARMIEDLGAYLRDFPERAKSPPEHMRGTRVISNPPGTTLLASLAFTAADRLPGIHEPLLEPLGGSQADPQLRRMTVAGLLLFMLLTGLWLAAGILFYLCGRLFFPPPASLAFAMVSLFSPMTIMFAPGKDCAQLLTVALPLYFWLLGWRRRRWWAAALAGVCFVPGCVLGLVHIVIALVVVGGTVLAGIRSMTAVRSVAVRCVLPAVAGAGLGVAVLWLATGLNLPATILAVGRAQGEITRGTNAMPYVWQLLGVPLFLLFAGPALWTFVLVRPLRAFIVAQSKGKRACFGDCLAGLAAGMMLFAVGYTNLETPRLWIPFVPLLLLGFMLAIRSLREPSVPVHRALALLVLAQVTASALSWSFMDPREAESRLADESYYHRPADVTGKAAPS